MGISSSVYYYKKQDNNRDKQLVRTIQAIHREYPYYGYRRIHRYLEKRGEVVNEKRIRRVMRENGLTTIGYKGFKVKTTDSSHNRRKYPNLVDGIGVEGVNQVWVSDITYIRLKEGFMYLDMILDMYSRKVVGWSISKNLFSGFCLEALKQAYKTRKPNSGCIHHSDQGVQYCSTEYTEYLKEKGFRISMGSKGVPYDNAYAESFFKTLKYEEVNLWNYETQQDVLNNLPYFIEEVYNKKRLHSSLDYNSPVEFENIKIKNLN